MKTSLMAICAVGFMSLATASNAALLTFEELGDTDPLTSQYDGLTFSNALIVGVGGALNEYEFPPRSGSKAVVDDGQPILIEFANPITSFDGYFTYTARLTATALSDSFETLATVQSAFVSNSLLSGDPGSAPNEFLGLSLSEPARYIKLEGASEGYSFVLDDMSYEVSAVPEPSSSALLLLGLVAVGATLFRADSRSLKAKAAIR